MFGILFFKEFKVGGGKRLYNRPVNEDAPTDEDRDMANYINGLPADAKVLVDDAVAYKIVAFTDDIKMLTMPYQDNFLSAVEAPGNYTGYILIASAKHPMAGYTILNSRYPPVVYPGGNNNASLQKVYQTTSWALYKFF